MIVKSYTEARPSQVQVTFSLPKDLWADRIYLVGDFNNWDRTSHPFDRDRSGGWSLSVELEQGRVYQFRYLLDDQDWLNDTEADSYADNGHGGTNFVVVTEVLEHAREVEA
jgi:1,4-alpha-glucan branching enzyme